MGWIGLGWMVGLGYIREGWVGLWMECVFVLVDNSVCCLCQAFLEGYWDGRMGR
jgi:hypothetical protein